MIVNEMNYNTNNKDFVINIESQSKLPTKEKIKEIYEEPKPLTRHISTLNPRKRNVMYSYGTPQFMDNEYGMNFERGIRSYSNSSASRLFNINGNNGVCPQQYQLRKQCRFSIIALSQDNESEGANIKIPLNKNAEGDMENNYIIGHSTDPSVLLNLNLTKSNNTKHTAVVLRKPTDLLKLGQTRFICYCYLIIILLTVLISK